MEDNELRIKDGKVVADAALALTQQTVSLQKEVSAELRGKAAVSEDKKEALKRQPGEKPAERVGEKAQDRGKSEARADDATAQKDEATPRRSANVVDIDA